jgi:hypothetical protein
MDYTIVSWIGGLMSVGLLVMNVFIALGVFRDAERIATIQQREVKIFTPQVWAIVCFFGSIPALALYALLHHSTLAKS